MPSIDLIGNSRHTKIFSKLQKIIFDLAGSDLAELDHVATFLELGFDSLFLIQMSTSMKGALGVDISFRQLIEETDTFEGLVLYLDEHLSENHDLFSQIEMPQNILEDAAEMISVQASMNGENSNNFSTSMSLPSVAENNSGMAALISQQLELMSHQLEVLRQHGNGTPQALHNHLREGKPRLAPSLNQPSSQTETVQQNTNAQEVKPFGAIARITRGKTEDLSSLQQKWLDDFIRRYNKRTTGSKEYAELHRPHMADPRVVTGFKSKIKDLIYPIVVDRTEGCHIWDLDGNEYVDALNGFGSNFFGYKHPKITQAVVDQLWRGAEIGPQSPIVGSLAKIICNFTGMERTAFCNTGSEAVMGAMRMARTVTGRSLIAIFNGAYHGIFDEVLVRGTRNLRSVPAAPGILPSSVENVLVLDYGTDEALKTLRERASELAAVMVEPIQSRRPEFRPREFLHAVRQITEESGSALIFDEVITGFRLGPGGAQEYYNIQADIATYGKVIGGGMPIGVMAGKARFMDALDGGAWSYGDASVPEVGVTYFAGTFVRHPAAMAACQAAMEILQEGGQAIYSRLTEQTTRLGAALNDYCEQVRAPLKVEWFSSLFRITPTEHVPYGELLFYLMRQRGVHIYDGFPCFLTMAHTDADVAHIINACQESIRELQDVGLLLTSSKTRNIAESELAVSVLSECGQDARNDVSDIAPTDVTNLKSQRANKEDSGFGISSDSSANRRFPLTEAQMEIWLASHISEIASCAYNEPFMLSLNGLLNIEALEGAIQEILCRHEALHLRFEGDEPFQTQILPERIPMSFLDISSLDAEAQQTKMAEILYRLGSTAFNLAAGPMVRVQTVRLHAEDHRVLFSSHHLVCDGWSWNVMLREIGAVYSAKVQGTSYQLPPAASYRSYVENEIKEQKSEKAGEAYSYWMNEFKEFPLPLEFPIDHPRPSIKTYNGATVSHLFDSNLYRALKNAAMRQKASLFSITFATFNVLLARLANQYDVVVTVPTAGQLAAPTDVLVGHCVNLLPVRSCFSPAMSFQQFLSATTQKILDVYDNQDCTLGGIIRRLQVPRDPSRLPLVEVNFNLDRDGAAMQFHGLNAAVEQTPKQAVYFDIFFNLNEMDGQLRVDIDYNKDLFAEQTIQQWLLSYTRLLEGIISDPETPVSHLPLFNEVERQHILEGWNQTSQPRDEGKSVYQLFEAQMSRTPDAVAVICGGEQRTYQELNRQANQLAYYLQDRGVAPGVKVGLCVERSVEMVIALLAILKAGGVYIPLDPTYPTERLAFILGDADVRILLTQTSLKERLPESATGVIFLNAEWEAISKEHETNLPCNISTSDQLAYIIYTSGSTGKPKGVEISHGALVNFLEAMCVNPGLTADDRLLAVTTISFDIAALEIYGPLVVGGQVHIVSADDAMDGRRLIEHLRVSKATVMQATPATWRMLVEMGWTGSSQLRMFCGGSVLSQELAELLCERGTELWNMYGPTETTIWSATHRVSSANRSIPIGRPIANTQMYVLDSLMQPVPIGVPGELYTGGMGVARGYWRRPELTREKFIPNPFNLELSTHLFKTGDMVRRLSDGNIEFLGRTDDQVKIRGFRIELGEIEAVLAQHPAVREAVVVAREEPSREKRLVAYLVSRMETTPSIADLRKFLIAKIPLYMVPSAFVWLDVLPLTPNGKIDRVNLPTEEHALDEKSTTYVAPRNSLESQMTVIWETVFERSPIGVTDNFFDLGGESLLAVRLGLQLEKAFQTKFEIPAIFQAQTIEQLVRLLEKDREEKAYSWLVPIQTSGLNRPIFCVFLGNTFKPYMKDFPEQPLYMFYNQGYDGLPVRYHTVEELAAQYIKEMREIQAHGPYHLAGYSFGGVVVYEMARQLHQQGQEVAFLALVDPTTPDLPSSSQSGWSNQLQYVLTGRGNEALASHHRGEIVLSLLSRVPRGLIRRIQELISTDRFKRIVCQMHFRLGRPLPHSLRRFYRHNVVNQLLKRYVLHPYFGETVLFQSSEILEPYWRALCGKVRRVYNISVGHMEVMKEPYVRTIYFQLMDSLQEAQRGKGLSIQEETFIEKNDIQSQENKTFA